LEGCRLNDMVEQFDAKPAEIRALFSHQLDPTRTAELRDRILVAGLPILSIFPESAVSCNEGCRFVISFAGIVGLGPALVAINVG